MQVLGHRLATKEGARLLDVRVAGFHHQPRAGIAFEDVAVDVLSLFCFTGIAGQHRTALRSRRRESPV